MFLISRSSRLLVHYILNSSSILEYHRSISRLPHFMLLASLRGKRMGKCRDKDERTQAEKLENSRNTGYRRA